MLFASRESASSRSGSQKRSEFPSGASGSRSPGIRSRSFLRAVISTGSTDGMAAFATGGRISGGGIAPPCPALRHFPLGLAFGACFSKQVSASVLIRFIVDAPFVLLLRFTKQAIRPLARVTQDHDDVFFCKVAGCGSVARQLCIFSRAHLGVHASRGLCVLDGCGPVQRLFERVVRTFPKLCLGEVV